MLAIVFRAGSCGRGISGGGWERVSSTARACAFDLDYNFVSYSIAGRVDLGCGTEKKDLKYIQSDVKFYPDLPSSLDALGPQKGVSAAYNSDHLFPPRHIQAAATFSSETLI